MSASKTNSLSQSEAFKGSFLDRRFRDAPLGFIDIGARGGAHGLIDVVADISAVLGFEAEPEECARLNAEAATWPYAQARMEPTAIAGSKGPATLYLTRNPNNSSLLKPSVNFSDRFGNTGLDVIKEIPVETETLDAVVFGAAGGGPRWGEILKVDAQGADYFILEGATRTLAENTVAVVCESLVIEMYEGQKVFSDIEQLMRERGFAFYGFVEMNMRSRRLLDKAALVGRERFFWGDAIFFKDPIAADGAAPQLTYRQRDALVLAALLLGYYDFALELAGATGLPADDQQQLKAIIEDLGGYSPERTIEDVRQLLAAMEAAPGDANILAGRYVDDRRTNFDYRDVRR